MPVVLSLINLKGGVAKTTTAVQLADTLAFVRGKKVLVLDLDPQTNATLALIGEERWAQADAQGQTLAHLFLDLLGGTRQFDPAAAILPGVSNLGGLVEAGTGSGGRVDLLPSSIRLIDVQDRMGDIAARTHYAVNPMEVVRQHLSPLFAGYDYVLIDCPPNLGFVTQNGLEVSDHYLIPTIPDRLSTYGIAQIAGRIAALRQARGLRLTCLGVVVTKYQSSSAQHQRGLARLPGELEAAFGAAGQAPPPVFKTILPQTNAAAEAMAYERPVTSYPHKYGRTPVGGQPAYRYGLHLAEEIETQLSQTLPARRGGQFSTWLRRMEPGEPA
ncbi:ParA family protein [Deinococcus hohokamensis]|uniref:ParA family protein n=1 Tax=Deinococcus hohokamensis TaxID=309883 RepID=A0ABV9IAM4_9DEIO